MKHVILSLLVAMIFVSGCKRRESAGPTVMLEEGKGALLVVFHRVPGADRETWLSQVTLIGPGDTKTLPRIPLANEQAVIVLNVPPAFYHVVAQAWLRKSEPHAGGSLAGVEIKPGRLTILHAQRLTGPERFSPEEPLHARGFVPWTLSKTEQFHEYVAGIIQSSVKG